MRAQIGVPTTMGAKGLRTAAPLTTLPETASVTLPEDRAWWRDAERLRAAQLALKWKWSSVFRLRCRDAAHINLKEVRALRAWLKRRWRNSGGREKSLVLVDTRVAAGAVNRGRSSSPALNAQL